MKLIRLYADGPFDLAETLDSGQVFHWERHDLPGRPGFAGCIGDRPVWIGQDGPDSLVTRPGDRKTVSSYCQLSDSTDSIHRSFPAGDAVLAEAISFCPGLRLLRQPVWECLATFITSALKQVAHIRQISLTLRRRYGAAHRIDDHAVHAFPTPEALAGAGEQALRDCALGYRARGLWRTAQAIASGEADLGILDTLDNREAREFLMQFHGVGEKVAHCVLLFGCGRVSAFPIDVWMDRILRDRYFGPRKRKTIKARELQLWAGKHFGPYAGYAQQYLFHFARKTRK